jgi:hypothetical protein
MGNEPDANTVAYVETGHVARADDFGGLVAVQVELHGRIAVPILDGIDVDPNADRLGAP